MAEGKRIVFSTATPNDQGGIIANNVIDFKRFKSNPVVLCQHDWNAPPLGKMVDIKEINGKLTGIPIFHRLTPESMVYADLYEAGFLNACSIGGEAEWEKNTAGQYILKDGLRQCKRFNLYEISMVTLPSNPDATAMQESESKLEAKLYDRAELSTVANSILTLSSKFNISKMKKTALQHKLDALTTALTAAKAQAEPDNEQIAALTAEVAAVQKDVDAEKEKLAAAGKLPDDPSASQLPGVIKELFGSFTHSIVNVIAALGGRATAATPKMPVSQDEHSTIENVPATPQPTPTGLTAKQQAAKEKFETAKKKAEEAHKKAEEAKEKADKEGASAEEMAAYKAAYNEAAQYTKEAADAEDELKACMEEKSTNGTGATTTTTQAGKKPEPNPVLKTVEQLKAALVTLAPKPVHNPAGAAVLKHRGVRFTELTAAKNEEGNRIFNRVMAKDAGTKSMEDYRIVLEAIKTDGKYSALTEKLRIIENVDETHLNSYRQKNPMHSDRRGKGVNDLLQELESGMIEVYNAKSNRVERTTLTSTDNALAAPALNTIEWLSLAIFELFPSTSWKDDIRMFPAEMTSKNTGLIWANIAAQPPVTKGNMPVNPTDYQVDDGAQALTLIPYWLGPMLWNPLTLHQLRYDKMTLQWAQSFAYWGSVMDDELLYILASTVPASSIISSSGYAAQPSFTLNPATPSQDTFYFNNQFNGALATPAYNDIAGLEQVYNNQNFDLGREKVRLVADPTALKYIKQDPTTFSLLTRWIESNSTDLLKISHTVLNMRSRVVAYDQATGQVKDPTSIMAATVVSAMLGFICSQVALGLGMLDVFFTQVPSSWGYRMSADIRIGAVPVRTNANGTLLYTYGTPKV